jgi:serpin B
MKKLLFAVVALLSLSLVACGTPAAANIVKSDKPRVTSPQVSEADQAALVEGNSNFAFLLYNELKANNNGNMFYSPYSISLMMAMAYAGAKGGTAQQISAAMSYGPDQDKLPAAFDSLSLQLEKYTSDTGNFKLDIVNDIWGQKNYSFMSAYLDVLAQYYGAGLRVLDFMNDPEGARQTINEYIYEKTNELINELIPQGSINNLTRLVLTNAIYFQAVWKSQFSSDDTHNREFKLLDGSRVTVSMMNQRSVFKYASGDGWKAVELPYQGDLIAMDIILPADFSSFETSLDSGTVYAILNAMSSRDLQLTMPKFKFGADFDLKAALSALGMPVAFEPGQADFSGISDAEELYIQDAIHKAYVAVDEKGTEAAAAGAVIVGTTSLPESFVIDSPFIFLIRDLQSGTILFMGRVLNPAS